MSAENVQVLRNGYDAFARQDVAGAHAHLWRMSGGKAVSFTEFGDTARTLAALGRAG